MAEKNITKRKLYELQFCIHELELYLDTHPTCQRTLELLRKFRTAYQELLALYEKEYGPFIMERSEVPAEKKWRWIDGPWPWEINWTEE
ncbi:MAG: spore coat protein CotJB [Clostridia bacterium]|nr:spore coat protein CotJB [Clostridia bacterium]